MSTVSRYQQPGWLLLPLRGFLGVTYTVASVQKLANPNFFQASSPISIQAQLRAFRHTSPIGGLVGVVAHHAVAVGLLIAIAELAVGLATLAGLWVRVAATVGALLALSFFLTVSWATSPYYYGADIVFLFAWTPFIAMGAAGVLAVDPLIAGRVRRELQLKPEQVRVSDSVRHEVTRRSLLYGGRAAAALAVLGGATGGLAAVVGRAIGGTKSAGPSTLSPVPSASGSSGPGTAIGHVDQVPVGQGGQFTDPASGNPAWIVRLSSTRFVAFSAVCTHAGCTVQLVPGALQFQCPCHGGIFDARTGQVISGPPPAPLPGIPVHITGTVISVD
jgi:thiosulfate dehydrogenase [quinone] large subunit